MQNEHTKLLKKCNALLKVIRKQGAKPVHLQYLRKLVIEHTHEYPQDSKFLYVCNLKSESLQSLIHTLIHTIQQQDAVNHDVVKPTPSIITTKWMKDDFQMVENLDKFQKCLRQHLYSGGSCVSWYNYLKSQDPTHVDSLLDVSRVLMNYVSPTDTILKYCLEEWDGTYDSLVQFSSKSEKTFMHTSLPSLNGIQEWKHFLPLRSIFQHMSLNDIHTQYVMYRDREESVHFEEYVRQHWLAQKKTTVRLDPSYGTYTTNFKVPLYLYYHYCFQSISIIDRDIMRKGFRNRFASDLFPIRQNINGKWRFGNDEFDIPDLHPSLLLRRIQSILPEWTFLPNRPSLVRIHYPGHVHNRKIRHQINTDMMWRQFIVSDLLNEDRYRLFAFCRMEMNECFRLFTKDTEKLFQKLEKKWETACVGHVLDFCTFVKICLSEQSPFCKYWISRELSHVLHSFRYRKIFVDSVFHYHSFMDSSFVYWRLLPSDLQTRVLRVFELEAVLDTYQRFFSNNHNKSTIFIHDFVLLPSNMDWAQRLYHIQYDPTISISMTPSRKNHVSDTVDPITVQYLDSWRQCPSFSHDLIIDKDDIFELEEDEEEWEDMEDACDIDEENIIIDDLD